MTRLPADTWPSALHRAKRSPIFFAIVGLGILLVGFFALRLALRQMSPVSALTGQSNVRMTFYGRAVDENGSALPGVKFDFQVDAYPADWTFETRGRDYERSRVSAVSDANGRFQFDVNGAMLHLITASIDGYRELYELDGGTRREDGFNSVFTRGIRLISWSAPMYRSDPERPAVFVFVSTGAQKTTALPSQGGFRLRAGPDWIENRAAWPQRPSLDDVDWAEGQPRLNVSVPLAFKAIDTNGRPMSGVSIAFDVVRYRTLREMRSDHYNDYSRMSRTKSDRCLLTTGSDGFARTTANGIRIKSVRAFLQPVGGPAPIVDARGSFYVRDFMDQCGDLIFRCDDESPIVLVMARPDEEVSHALPSRGGYERRGTTGRWERVEPAWPDDVQWAIQYVAPDPKSAPAEAAASRPGG